MSGLEAMAPGWVAFLHKRFTPERLGSVPAGGPIEPKRTRKKPKHKKQAEDGLG